MCPFGWVVAFAALSVCAALILFCLSVWKDYDREWRGYQRTFREMLFARAGTEEERKAALASGGSVRADHRGRRRARRQVRHVPPRRRAPGRSRTPTSLSPGTPPSRRIAFERFGCTVCHQGQGRATRRSGRPRRSRVLGRSRCCGEGSFRRVAAPATQGTLKDAPLIQRGKLLYLMNGCLACHKIRGAGGVVGARPDVCRRSQEGPEVAHRTLQVPAEGFARLRHARLRPFKA